MTIVYSDIAVYLRDKLQDELPEAEVIIEPDTFGENLLDEVGIRLSAQKNEEVHLGSPDPYRATLEYKVVCSVWHPDGVLEAYRRRDILIEKVTAILKTDRTLGGLSGSTQLGDFDFDYMRNEHGYFCAGLITLNVFDIT